MYLIAGKVQSENDAAALTACASGPAFKPEDLGRIEKLLSLGATFMREFDDGPGESYQDTGLGMLQLMLEKDAELLKAQAELEKALKPVP